MAFNFWKFRRGVAINELVGGFGGASSFQARKAALDRMTAIYAELGRAIGGALQDVGRSLKASKILGVPELKRKIRALKNDMVAEAAQRVVGEAARYISSEVRYGAESVKVPHEVFKNIFSYSKLRTQPGAKVSALAGIRKRGRARPYAVSYMEWRNKAAYTRLRWKGRGKTRTFKAGGVVAERALVGENLATMWELGTSKRPATPFFRPAIQRAQNRVAAILYDGYSAIIGKYGNALTPKATDKK